MSSKQLEITARDFLRSTARRNRSRRRVLALPPSMIGLAGFVAATMPVGKPDFGALVIAAALAWGAHMLLKPLRDRSEERFFERAAIRYQQLVAAKGLPLPGSTQHLLLANSHKEVARALVMRLPGGPALLEETADGAVWFGETKTASPAKGDSFQTLSQFAAAHGMSPAVRNLLKKSGATESLGGLPPEIAEKLKAHADATYSAAQKGPADNQAEASPPPANDEQPPVRDFIPLDPFDDDEDEAGAAASGR